MLNRPGILLRLEGLCVLAVAAILYAVSGANWWVFALLFLWPDLFMLGYLVNARVRAATYNAAHCYAGPAVPAGFALGFGLEIWLPFTLIWAAHLGFDRALGYGLKYPAHFKDTHLQRLAGTATPVRSEHV